MRDPISQAQSQFPLTKQELNSLIKAARLTIEEFGGTPLSSFAMAIQFFFDDINQDEVPEYEVALLISMGFGRILDILTFANDNPEFVFLTARMNEITYATRRPSGSSGWLGATLPTLIEQFNVLAPLMHYDPHFGVIRPAVEFYASRARAKHPVNVSAVVSDISSTLQRLSRV
jgi:hypothetical protein